MCLTKTVAGVQQLSIFPGEPALHFPWCPPPLWRHSLSQGQVCKPGNSLSDSPTDSIEWVRESDQVIAWCFDKLNIL